MIPHAKIRPPVYEKIAQCLREHCDSEREKLTEADKEQCLFVLGHLAGNIASSTNRPAQSVTIFIERVAGYIPGLKVELMQK